MKNLFAKILLVSVLISLFAGCVQQAPTGNTTNPTLTPTITASSPAKMRLATTTSTCETGLLDIFNKKFEQENNVKIFTVCEGTGKAIATGELGAADVLIVHSVQAELKAVVNGSFINRTYMMYNYFVIIGPENDPAGTWYQSVGKGMGDTITTADIKNGYTLSDRGTYLAMKYINYATSSKVHEKKRKLANHVPYIFFTLLLLRHHT